MNHNANAVTVRFLTISRCRVREHYGPKLRQCLEALGPDALWHLDDEHVGRPIGAIVRHLLEHIQRHITWIHTGARPSAPARLEDFFPTTGELPAALAECAADIIATWDDAMAGLIRQVAEIGVLPSNGPGIDAIYHLVEHVSYHLGQVVVLTAKAAKREFAFCQRGINEAGLAKAVDAEMP